MATVWWFYGLNTTAWNDFTNWWSDSAHTVPNGSVPAPGDDVVILGATMPSTNPVSSVALNSFDSSGASTGTSFLLNGNITCPTVTIGVSGDVTSTHTWNNDVGSGSGTVTVQGGSVYAMTPGDSVGTVVFSDSAGFSPPSSGTVVAMTFGNVSSWPPGSGAVTIGTLVFNDGAVMNGTGATATVTTASFNNTSTFTGGTIAGAVTIDALHGAAANGGGSINGALTVNPGLVGATFPTASQVLAGVSFGPTNNLHGNVSLPNASQVLSLVGFGPSGGIAGTVTLPTTGQVLAGVTFGASGGSTGTVTLPTVSQVLSPITFGAAGGSTGNVTLPAAGNVKAGVTYGPSGGTTGTLPDFWATALPGSYTGNQAGAILAAILAALPTHLSLLAIDTNGRVAIQSSIPINTAIPNFPFVMYTAAGVPTAGLTVTATRRIDGGSFAACANSPADEGNGDYSINLSASDVNGKVIQFQFTAPGAVATFVTIITTP